MEEWKESLQSAIYFLEHQKNIAKSESVKNIYEMASVSLSRQMEIYEYCSSRENCDSCKNGQDKYECINDFLIAIKRVTDIKEVGIYDSNNKPVQKDDIVKIYIDTDMFDKNVYYYYQIRYDEKKGKYILFDILNNEENKICLLMTSISEKVEDINEMKELIKAMSNNKKKDEE